MEAQLLKIGGERLNLGPRNGKKFELPELEEILCCFIEIVDLKNGYIMVVDEEGRLKHSKINTAATLMLGSPVVGDVIVCQRKLVKM